MSNATKNALFSFGPQLFNVAREAVGRADSNRHDSLVAIVFAAAAQETFVNEILEQIRFSPDDTGALRQLASLTEEIRHSNMSLMLKLQLLSSILQGRTFDKTGRPYQDLLLLVRLRNALLHLWPETVDLEEQRPHKLLRALESRGLVEEAAKVPPFAWIGAVVQPVVAAWAFDTAIQTCRTVADWLPEEWRKQAHRSIDAHEKPEVMSTWDLRRIDDPREE